MKANVFLLLGVALLLVGVSLQGLVTVTVDTTPPEFVWTVPGKQKDYNNPITILACVFDGESVISTVKFRYSSDFGLTWTWIDLRPQAQGPTPMATLATGEEIKWTTEPITLDVGMYAYEFEATNEAGATRVYPKSKGGVLVDWFSVQGGTLKGKWYINNEEVNSADQILTFSTRQLCFRFEVTHGLSSRAYIKWTGKNDGQLNLGIVQESRKYSGNTTFSDGTYRIDLIASDMASPSHDIVMATVEVNVGQPEAPIPLPHLPSLPPLPFDATSMTFMAVGACLVVYGFARKRRTKT